MRAEEAKIVQEKAAKIKEWVTLKLEEVSQIFILEVLRYAWVGCPLSPGFSASSRLGPGLAWPSCY
jgi:hypothetical protein